MEKIDQHTEKDKISNEFIKKLLEKTNSCWHTDDDNEAGSESLSLFYNSGLLASLKLKKNTLYVYPQEDEYCDQTNEKQLKRDLKKLVEAIKSIAPELKIIVYEYHSNDYYIDLFVRKYGFGRKVT